MFEKNLDPILELQKKINKKMKMGTKSYSLIDKI